MKRDTQHSNNHTREAKRRGRKKEKKQRTLSFVSDTKLNTIVSMNRTRCARMWESTSLIMYLIQLFSKFSSFRMIYMDQKRLAGPLILNCVNILNCVCALALAWTGLVSEPSTHLPNTMAIAVYDLLLLFTAHYLYCWRFFSVTSRFAHSYLFLLRWDLSCCFSLSIHSALRLQQKSSVIAKCNI